jgi:hypothetical protein
MVRGANNSSKPPRRASRMGVRSDDGGEEVSETCMGSRMVFWERL